MIRNHTFLHHRFLFPFVSVFLSSGVLVNAVPPAWWSAGFAPVVDPMAIPNNHGVAKIGQAKWMAKSALDALRAADPLLASQIEANLVGPGLPIMSWDAPSNPAESEAQHAALLVGQLKAIATPFYDVLHATHPDWLAAQRSENGTETGDGYYPWTNVTTDDANRAFAKIGQLKSAFSLRFETLDLDDGGDAVRDGFTQNSIPANDDGYTLSTVPIGFSISLFGNTRTQCWVNNNGNITFSGPLGTYTPEPLQTLGMEMIAPFWADVDTRADRSQLVTYGAGAVDGHAAFGVNWVNVGYYSYHAEKRNSFQLVLIQRSDTGTGNFDIEFNYDKVLWETGEASGGVNGYGGSPSRSGLTNGSNRTIELAYSGQTLVQLDKNPSTGVTNTTTGLRYRSRNSTVPGRFVFQVRSGVVQGALTVDAGPDVFFDSMQTSAVLAGTASDPNGGAVSVEWKVVEGNASQVSFSDPHSLTPTVTYSAGEPYKLQLTITSLTDPSISAADVMRIN